MAEEPAVDIGIVDRPAGSRARDLQDVRPRRPEDEDRRRGLLLAAAAIFAAVAALVAVPLFTRGDDDSATTNESVDDQDQANAELPSVLDGRDDRESEAPTSFEPPSAEHLRADEVASLFERQIDGDQRYGIAYVADADFVVLDHRGITVPDLEIAVDFATVSELALLTNDGRTWAIDPEDRDRSFLVSNSYVVIVSGRPGTIAVIRPGDRTQIGLMSSALPVPPVLLPDGADLLWVQGRGPLVMPRTGGTFEVSGLASSLERISDGRAVAASAMGTVYESCDDSLRCTYSSQADDGPLVALPSDLTGDFILSPDGEWIVATNDDSTRVVQVSTGRMVADLDAGSTAIAWAPDSTFVAIIQGDALAVFYPASNTVVPMRLNHVPDENSLLVFAS